MREMGSNSGPHALEASTLTTPLARPKLKIRYLLREFDIKQNLDKSTKLDKLFLFRPTKIYRHVCTEMVKMCVKLFNIELTA